MSETEGTRPEPAESHLHRESHEQVRTPSGSEIEYRHLISYFEKLVKLSFAAILVVLTAAGLLLWKNTSDIQNQAKTTIDTTKDTAAREISKIGEDATAIARAEAQRRIDEAFEKRNVQQMIEHIAREKVGSAVDREIERNLGARIRKFENEIAETGEISNAGARLRLGFRPALDTLVKRAESPNQAVRQYAQSTLLLVGSDYETRIKELLPAGQASPSRAPSMFLHPPPNTLKELLGVIRHSDNVFGVAAAFLALREMTGTQIRVFDIPAAERWCAEHRPKCD